VLQLQSEIESDSYFNNRPRGSKLGAWVSEQSKIIQSRKVLDEKYSELSAKYPDDNIPRPSYWGGYILKPSSIEFWQGRPSRLHDRILFSLVNNAWEIERLAP
jgi:pyridoxamine 5'-phosphate oxidase